MNIFMQLDLNLVKKLFCKLITKKLMFTYILYVFARYESIYLLTKLVHIYLHV